MANSRPAASQLVQVISEGAIVPGRRWNPIVGQDTQNLLQDLRLPEESSRRLRDEAIEVLARCVSPHEKAATETGLAVGYVQSGKTMSFTTVAALARDNGYQIVIVIAGTSKPLLQQSTDRLKRDLRIDRDNRGWQLFESGLMSKNTLPGMREQLKATLATWKGEMNLPFSWMRRTALIVVMKHAQHLENVRALLKGLDLKSAPVLIIDDEADQASLNAAVRRDERTKTYSRISDLRASLPHHTFLQYTATPQAPLLLNIIDSLSPKFAEVLTPGSDYVGGKDFFLLGGSNYVREIPEDDLPGVVPKEQVPESLLNAMQLFFIGAAAGPLELGKENRSMLVHPSQQRTGHSEYYGWVMSTRGTWATILNSKSGYEDDKKELLAEFAAAYDDIAKTAPDIKSKSEILNLLPYVVANTVVQEVNAKAGQTPKIDWKANYSHILVGGQAMDRGFTVEGLIVTYMPRSLGVGNADTVQQRARFLGYKRQYLGYCRVFLEGASIEAYKKYVKHEEDMRARLIAHRMTGKPLSAWKRMFYLDKSLRPTRNSVLQLEYFRESALGNGWFTPDKPNESEQTATANRDVFASLRAFLKDDLAEDPGSNGRSEYQRHLYARVPLKRIFAEYVLQIQFGDPDDSREFTARQILFAELLDRNVHQECTIYFMSHGKPRERRLNDERELINLYQGADPSKPKEDVGLVYPGDRFICAQDVPTIQVHFLKLLDSKKVPVAANIPTIAVHLPTGVVSDLLVQPQPEQHRSQ